jgi:hypothetical protein
MTSEVVSLDRARAQLLGRPLIHAAPRGPVEAPNEKIIAANDMWLVDSILDVAESIMGRLLKTEKPLDPRERSQLIRIKALFPEPGE